MKKINK